VDYYLDTFFLLRRSEYLFIGKRVHSYVLRLAAIQFFDRNEQVVAPRKTEMVGIRLNGAKNNQFGREEIRYHFKSSDMMLCPVRAAWWVHKAAAAFGTRGEDPAISTGSGGISAEDVSKLLKRAAATSVLDPTRFSTHSVRIGGATALLNAGADRLVVKLMGRWLSNAFEEYPVLSSKGSAGLARLMC
jgi:hypothetical protein